MKNDQSDNLSDLLKQWQPEPLSPAQIRAGVWSRIENKRENPLAEVFVRITSWFERPLIAGGLVALALVAGIALGSTTSAEAQTQAYLQSVVAFRN